MSKIALLLKLIKGLDMKKMKAAFFSDGVFNWKRAITLLIGGALVYLVGWSVNWNSEIMGLFIDVMDDLSDIIGYAEQAS